jgi:hypothetical protein
MASGVFSAFTRSIILMTKNAQWTFKVDGVVCDWQWVDGGPDVTRLDSVRNPTSTEYSRHVPVHAYLTTMKRVLPLESGLEFELALWLDRRSNVECLVPQPCRITSSEGVRHVPDLLEGRLDGTVTVWDARPTERQDAEFLSLVALSEKACDAVGWAYRVFDGLTRVESQNLRWVSGYRRAPEWIEGAWPALAELLIDGAAIGDVLDSDDQGGHMTAAMWHLIWAGDVSVDFSCPWSKNTQIRWNGTPK